MRASRLRFTAGLALTALSAAPMSAQVTSGVEVRAHASREAHVGDWQGASVLGASLRFDRPHWSVESAGDLTSDWDRWQQRASLSASALSPAFGPLQISATGTVARSNRSGPIHTALQAGGRASLRMGQRGAWVGVDARHVDGVQAPGDRAWPVIGAWQQLGSALVSLQWSPRRARVPGAFDNGVLSGPDSIFNDTLGIWEPYSTGPASDSGFASTLRSWSDAEARLLWARGRLAIDATLGGRLAALDMNDAVWAQIQGLYALTPRLALIAATGNAPADPALGWERQRFASLGVRLLGGPEPRAHPPVEVRPGAAEFRVEPVRDAEFLIRVRVPSARTVELSADFTGWQPISLTRASADWWQATVQIAPGTHHVNIRINGDAWTAPPGTPAIEDEFNGTVGLVVVQ